MSYRRNRLSLRIPWLVEAVAEGPLAIVVLLVLVILLSRQKEPVGGRSPSKVCVPKTSSTRARNWRSSLQRRSLAATSIALENVTDQLNET
jgi:hypothetical protein